MASGIYDKFKYNLMTKKVNLITDTIKVALMTNSHSFVSTDTSSSSVLTNQITGTGYTTGGATLAGQSVTEGASTKWDATTDTEWTSATFSAWHAVLYDTTVDATTNNVICSIDFNGEQAVSTGTFKIIWNSSGIMTLAG
jgi:hypothetical protein